MNKQRREALSLVAILMAAAGLLAGGVLLQRRTEIRRKAVYSNIDVSLHPQPLEVCKGGTGKVVVKVNPGPEDAPETAEIQAAELRFGFDNGLVAVEDVNFHKDYGASIWIPAVTSEGEIRLSALTTKQTVPTSVFDLVEIIFSGQEEGEFELTLDDYNVGGARHTDEVNMDRELEINNPDQVKTQIKVIDCGDETSWPQMTFKVRFAGTEYKVGEKEIIVSDIPDQKVDVVVKGEEQRREYNNVNVSFNKQAIGNGTLDLVGITPGSGYTILLKGPVHLAQRFCIDEQKEHCWLGQGDLTITSGENVFDWTGLELEPGDINRDGVVDTADFTMLKAALGKSGENIPEDLNRNGAVRGQDVVFFLQTLSKRYEDEI